VSGVPGSNGSAQVDVAPVAKANNTAAIISSKRVLFDWFADMGCPPLDFNKALGPAGKINPGIFS
jgi:hypothetical protein